MWWEWKKIVQQWDDWQRWLRSKPSTTTKRCIKEVLSINCNCCCAIGVLMLTACDTWYNDNSQISASLDRIIVYFYIQSEKHDCSAFNTWIPFFFFFHSIAHIPSWATSHWNSPIHMVSMLLSCEWQNMFNDCIPVLLFTRTAEREREKKAESDESEMRGVLFSSARWRPILHHSSTFNWKQTSTFNELELGE